jgi:hypothetical protein
MRRSRSMSLSSLSSISAFRVLPRRNDGSGKESSPLPTAAAGGMYRGLITTSRLAPSRRAGDSGTFCRSPPSQWKAPSIFTAGNMSGMAAEAIACWAPISAATGFTVRSCSQSGSPCSRCCTNTVVRPDATWVVDTVSASRWPARRFGAIRSKGTVSSSSRSSVEGSSSAPCRGPSPPRPVSPIRWRASWYISRTSGRMMSPMRSDVHALTRVAARREGSSARAASTHALMAPIDVPHRMSIRTSRPISRGTSSRMCCTTPTSYAPLAAPPARTSASRPLTAGSPSSSRPRSTARRAARSAWPIAPAPCRPRRRGRAGPRSSRGCRPARG